MRGNVIVSKASLAEKKLSYVSISGSFLAPFWRGFTFFIITLFLVLLYLDSYTSPCPKMVVSKYATSLMMINYHTNQNKVNSRLKFFILHLGKFNLVSKNFSEIDCKFFSCNCYILCLYKKSNNN